MRVTYYGQACTLIEVAGRKILTDPWLTEGAYSGTWYHTHLLADAGVSPEMFPKDVDYIFLSHEHEDHLDPVTLRCFGADVPILICRFATRKFRTYLESLGLAHIQEVDSGGSVDLGNGVEATIFGSAEYTNDSAILVTGEGRSIFNETDCKLGYRDLEQLRARQIDIGFFMFSGANWYPMLYQGPDAIKREQVRRRRKALLRGFVERVKVTQPRIAVPAAGPCTVLDPDLFWLNSEESGIFIDPHEAVRAVTAAGLSSQALFMAATDVWDSTNGLQRRGPAPFYGSRKEYLNDTAARMAAAVAAQKAAEPPARSDLPDLFTRYFECRVAAQTPQIRSRIGTKLAVHVTGRHGGSWTVDFTSPTPPFVREGEADDWTYRIEVEDKLIYPFVDGELPFFEDLFLSLRVKLARRPDVYNEPLYHFFYEPDPQKLHNWYATR